MDDKAFEMAQESIINEIGYALNELICGRTEEAYNILVNLRDELVTDLIYVDESEKKFDELIKEAGKLYIENEYKKELANDSESID